MFHQKLRVFMRRLARDILPTKESLSKKGLDVGGGCYMCGGGDETMQHLFFNFPFVQGAAAGMPDGGIGQESIAGWLEGCKGIWNH